MAASYQVTDHFRYALFCFSNFLLNACVDNPYVYIPDHAKSIPSVQEGAGAFIISVLGVLNTLGVVIVGYIGDKPWIDPSLLYAICTVIAGASVAAIPLLESYFPLAIASAIYGFTISANYTLVPEIVVNLISLDNFTGAYGLLLMIQGLASLIGPPFAGWLYDISGSYDSTFYISGISILASGLLVIPVADYWTCSCDPRPLGEEHIDQGTALAERGDEATFLHDSMIQTNADEANQPFLVVDRYTIDRTPFRESPLTSPSACHSPARSNSPTRVRFRLSPSPTPSSKSTAATATASSAVYTQPATLN
ncbi:monocarboxylate transporter 9 [Galendromus occidentalis]|uniref:Monocarboxylate transporter 9 n=1 Tax=Galendromus occidentalis TaxID=34638 RepID=A0AAJ7P9I5_9ACAR|nr:monocarboxylate transporter 9 [Galendromus occidentalis]